MASVAMAPRGLHGSTLGATRCVCQRQRRPPPFVCVGAAGKKGGGTGKGGSAPRKQQQQSKGGGGIGSSGGSGGGGRGRGGGGGKATKQQQQQRAPAPGHLVPPLLIAPGQQLAGTERVPSPLWGTFCGVSNGMWVGVAGAYNPSTGEAEALALDERGKPLLSLLQCCVEERRVEGGADGVVRHTARAATPAALAAEMVAGGVQSYVPACSPGEGGGDGEPGCWDSEPAVAAGEEGLFIFDGGSYSSGPPAIGTPAVWSRPHSPPTFDEAAAEAAAAARAEAEAQAAAAAEAADGEGAGGEWEEGEEWGAGDDDEEESGDEWGEDDDEELGGVLLASGSSAEATAAAAAAVAERRRQLEYALAEGLLEGGAGSEEEEQDALDAHEAWRTAVIESCLQWGGQERVRVSVVLGVAGGGDRTELEVVPLRVTVAREAWEGAPGHYTPAQQSAVAAMRQSASASVRLDARSLVGSWKRFDITGVMVEDLSMETGLPEVLASYTSREDSVALSLAGGGQGSAGEEGALLLLPHSVGVQLRMVPMTYTPSSPPTTGGEGEEGSEEGEGGSEELLGLGLEMCVVWHAEPGTLALISRLYRPDGQLHHAASATCIRA